MDGSGQKDTAADPPARNLHSVIACNLGVCLEGFDFIAFSAFSVILARTFFPAADPLTQALFGFGSFGVAYLARPIGGLFWGMYADRVGRRPALAAIAVLMGIGTAMIALIPSYHTIGLTAAVLVVIARLIQGFAASGEFASATSLLVELAPAGHRGLYSSTQMAAQTLTVAIVSGLVLTMFETLSTAQLESWGWRVVFGIGALVGPFGFYLRQKMLESPVFVRSHEARTRGSLLETFRTYRRQMLCMAGLIVVGSASFYLVLIFLPVFATRRLGLTTQAAQISTAICALVQSAICIYAGRLSDQLGRTRVLLPAALAYAAVAYPLFAYLIAHPSFHALLVVQMTTCVILGFISGPLPAALSELLPASVRSTGMGVAYNTIGALFGGLGPFLITLIVGVTGDDAGPAYWASFTGLIGAAAVLAQRFAPAPSERAAYP